MHDVHGKKCPTRHEGMHAWWQWPWGAGGGGVTMHAYGIGLFPL